MIFVIPVRYHFQSYSHRFVGIDNTSIFGLVLPILRQVSPRQLQSIAAASEFPTFYERLFMVCVNSSSSGSMKKIPRNCLALSILVFSIAHFCFCILFRCMRHMLPHIWPHFVWTRGCLFPRQSPSQTKYILQVAFRSIERIL